MGISYAKMGDDMFAVEWAGSGNSAEEGWWWWGLTRKAAPWLGLCAVMCETGKGTAVGDTVGAEQSGSLGTAGGWAGGAVG